MNTFHLQAAIGHNMPDVLEDCAGFNDIVLPQSRSVLNGT